MLLVRFPDETLFFFKLFFCLFKMFVKNVTMCYAELRFSFFYFGESYICNVMQFFIVIFIICTHVPETRPSLNFFSCKNVCHYVFPWLVMSNFAEICLILTTYVDKMRIMPNIVEKISVKKMPS